MKQEKATLLWIDLEMTGLEPGVDKIIEVAAIGTDWQLRPLCSYTAVVQVPDELMRRRMVGAFWEENHESRDALMAQNATGRPAAEVEQELLGFLAEHFAPESCPKDKRAAGKIILAGNSIHQDRKFIDLEWPQLARRLHYRMLDVSAWKVYFECALGKRFIKPEVHRALDDIQGSIAELRFYLHYVRHHTGRPYLEVKDEATAGDADVAKADALKAAEPAPANTAKAAKVAEPAPAKEADV